MKKRYNFAIILVLLFISIFLICSKNSDNTTLDEVRLKDNEASKKQFAVYIRDSKDSEYTEYTNDNNLIPEGYKLDLEQSGCVDNNGNEVKEEGIIIQTADNKITLKSNKTVYCYLYFEKNSLAGDILKEKVNQGGLIQTNDGTDLGYRYVGSKDNQPDNYICFGWENCTKGTNKDKFLYRIIGISLDGKLKLIKNKALPNKYEWHSINTDNAVWDVSNSGKLEADLHKNLNGETFLTNSTYISSGWQEKIENKNWYIGDGKGYSVTNGDAVWKWEQKIKSSTPAKIGLMYLSDYYYSLDGTGSLDCYTTSGKDEYQTCKTSWLHLSNNGDNSTTNSHEWTMSRYGYNYSDYGSSYYAWYITYAGNLIANSLYNTEAVRPVFYLNEKEKIISGTGTSSDPYILERPEEPGNRIAEEKFNGTIPKGFKTILIADLYRFIGDKDMTINNYICFGTTDNCYDKDNSKADYRYRIIGIDDIGRLKLIKDTALDTNTQWHSGYQGSTNNSVWDKGDGKISADLYTNLNGINFLENKTYVPREGNWQEKIDATKWYIGDSKNDGKGYSDTGDNVWKWEQTTTAGVSSKIGLIYLSDYYYSLDGTGSLNCKDSSYYGTCKTSWLHITNNSLSQNYIEWTMSRYGYIGGYYGAWFVHFDGQSASHSLDGEFAVRPVFYLTSDTKIKSGTGVLEDPFILSGN